MAVGVYTDEEVRQMVVDELYWDGRVDAANIQVKVHKLRVTLTGTVSTYAALGAAEEDARAVAGVENVENRLVVRQPAHALVPADQELAARLMDTLRWQAQIDAADVRVAVEEGRVTLQGTVPAYRQKVKAQAVASGLLGVIGVTNELAVVPARKYEDRRIAEAIKAALDRNIYIDAEMVNVRVSDGVVTLAGDVPDRRAYRAAENAARYTPGVVDVINDLTIGGEPVERNR
jgi:osmotically-inducible protein OsmY